MPIKMETTPETPNAIYAPSIHISCGILNGKLRPSVHITFAAAKVENAGQENETWEQTGQIQTVYISDVMNLEEDLAALQPQVLTMYGGIVNLVAAINAIRKVL